MKYYNNNKVLGYEDDGYDDNFARNIVKFEDDNTFHIGQDYENEVAKTYVCTKCGGKSFNVGKGDYWTGIKCITCGWEVCCHEG